MAKASPGSPFKVPPAPLWNNIEGAGEKHGRLQLGQLSERDGREPQLDRVTVRNDSGSNLQAGRVLEIGSKLLTEVSQEKLWFAGSLPAPNGTKLWGIAHKPIAQDKIGELITTGNVVARVIVGHASHRYADIVASSTTLVSGWHGVPIVYKQSGTGTFDDCVLQLGSQFNGPIEGKVSAAAGIAAGATGSVTVWVAGVESSPAHSVQAQFSWMATGTLPFNAQCLVWWVPDQQKFKIYNSSCPVIS